MKCPKCGKEIKRLKKIVYYEVVVHEEDLCVEENDIKRIKINKTLDKRVKDVMYFCAECNALITDVDKWAEMILRGEEDKVYKEWNKV